MSATDRTEYPAPATRFDRGSFRRLARCGGAPIGLLFALAVAGCGEKAQSQAAAPPPPVTVAQRSNGPSPTGTSSPAASRRFRSVRASAASSPMSSSKMATWFMPATCFTSSTRGRLRRWPSKPMASLPTPGFLRRRSVARPHGRLRPDLRSSRRRRIACAIECATIARFATGRRWTARSASSLDTFAGHVEHVYSVAQGGEHSSDFWALEAANVVEDIHRRFQFARAEAQAMGLTGSSRSSRDALACSCTKSSARTRMHRPPAGTDRAGNSRRCRIRSHNIALRCQSYIRA